MLLASENYCSVRITRPEGPDLLTQICASGTQSPFSEVEPPSPLGMEEIHHAHYWL